MFPDLPGCISSGADYDEAFRMAHEALALYAEGEANLPEPRTLERIKAEWEYWKEWEQNYRFLVGEVCLYPLKGRTKKFNISMDEGLVSRIDRVTKNRSAFITQAVEHMLETAL